MTELQRVLAQVLEHLRANRWTEAHNLVQTDNSPLSNWLHGIVHIQEGDLEDAQYWYDQAHRNFRSRGTLAEEMERFEAELLPNQ
ncbi:hypothetical protein [Rhodoferax sp.]|uniref:hypothetical protein n=1 Tax=Rhodoferax sp. TaxID=50421 RepID=UPI0025CF2C42|nr:hypothetical protein [Rhodoferax sp.]